MQKQVPLKKKIIYLLAFFFLLGGILAYNYYQKIFGEAITEKYVLYVNSDDTLQDIKAHIKDISKNPNTFLWVAARKNFSKPKVGRYVLTKGMSNNDLVNMLRGGMQTPLKISFNNQDTLEKFAGRISNQIQADSISLLKSFTNKEFLLKNKLSDKGYEAGLIAATNNFDKERLLSDWSHRHAAYIAGLGTFGINNMLITTKGCAGRIGSIVTNLKLQPTERPKEEFCLYKYNGSCKACVKRCIVDALSENSADFARFDCYDICLKNDDYHQDLGLTDVCGKCCVDLPCTAENPVN